MGKRDKKLGETMLLKFINYDRESVFIEADAVSSIEPCDSRGEFCFVYIGARFLGAGHVIQIRGSANDVAKKIMELKTGIIND